MGSGVFREIVLYTILYTETHLIRDELWLRIYNCKHFCTDTKLNIIFKLNLYVTLLQDKNYLRLLRQR